MTWFWWFMFVCNLLYPAAMIMGGWYMEKRCSLQKSPYLGYRTRRSKASLEAWRFANIHCGKRWQRVGWIMLVPTVLVQLPFVGSNEDVIGLCGLIICAVDISVMILSILPTEKALAARFDLNGKPL